MVSPQLVHHGWQAIETAITGGVLWVGRYFVSLAKEEWDDMKSKINTIATTTQVQAENHLQTIQTNTGKTNDILERMAEGQAEMNGWLKGRLQ